jgi:hypothetical protein
VSPEDAARRDPDEEGYDPQFEARSLKRAIQRLLLDPPAMNLFDGEIKPGERSKVTVENGELKFQRPKQVAGATCERPIPATGSIFKGRTSNYYGLNKASYFASYSLKISRPFREPVFSYETNASKSWGASTNCS